MSTAPKATKQAAKKQIKKLTIEITDPEAVLNKYPGVEKIITKRTVDRKKLRPIVNALFAVGVQVDGVNAFYATDDAAPEKTAALTQIAS